MTASQDPTATRAKLEEIFQTLDYDGLGPIYCDEGGDEFWAAHRGPALEQGQAWAQALLPRLSGEGSSLYVGAGVAELPVLVAEVLETERSVVATNLLAEECTILNAALGAHGLADRIEIRCEDASVAAGTFDHISIVSVLNDPGTYPLVSGVAYGRIPPVLLDVEAFVAERDRVRGLVAGLFDKLAVPGWVTTTFEEVPWLLAAAEARGCPVEADEDVIETAIVGDPLGFLRIG